MSDQVRTADLDVDGVLLLLGVQLAVLYDEAQRGRIAYDELRREAADIRAEVAALRKAIKSIRRQVAELNRAIEASDGGEVAGSHRDMDGQEHRSSGSASAQATRSAG
jgi:uncharacterized coiled-coil DUF342 family protein